MVEVVKDGTEAPMGEPQASPMGAPVWSPVVPPSRAGDSVTLSPEEEGRRLDSVVHSSPSPSSPTVQSQGTSGKVDLQMEQLMAPLSAIEQMLQQWPAGYRSSSRER